MNLRAGRLLAGAVWLELLRRRDLGLLLTLTGALSLCVLAARLYGVDNPQTGTFLLNLGLSWAWLGAHGITLLLAARQMPQEIEQRTLHTLLARPVGRGELVLAKWAASAIGGMAVFAVLLAPGWLIPPHLEAYAASTLGQALVAAGLSLSLAAALAVCASLWMNRAVATVLPGLVFLFGAQAAGWAQAWGAERGWMGRGIAWIGGWIPDFAKFNLFTRYTDGIGPAGMADMAGLAAYALVFGGFLLAAAAARFERMRL